MDQSRFFLVVGLGNPGAQFEKTRHNIGFLVIDKLAEKFEARVKREECKSLVGEFGFEGYRVGLAKPQTFMNLSGEAVSCLLSKRQCGTESLIVISDDLALPFGELRLRRAGSHGGHNGLRSIIHCLSSETFPRLRIGIRPLEYEISDARSFVLGKFSKSENERLEDIVSRASEAIITMIEKGIEYAMSKFNGPAAISTEQ
ncbi:MAG TPA: aminoacyl-tRNA hydrolase [Pyrinomonadaceae bacterium]|nr:aminoacyl-tRNA hydrolase [Pyrinomonadaceae bacterium]